MYGSGMRAFLPSKPLYKAREHLAAAAAAPEGTAGWHVMMRQRDPWQPDMQAVPAPQPAGRK
jgi:hypothetical protein